MRGRAGKHRIPYWVALSGVMGLLALLPSGSAVGQVWHLAPVGFNGGTGTWFDHTGVFGAQDTFVSDDLRTYNENFGRNLRWVINNVDPSLSTAVVNSVVVHFEQRIPNHLDDRWTLHAYIGGGATAFAGPIDVLGSATDAVRTWDLTALRAWTISDLNLLEVKATSKVIGLTDGRWEIDQMKVVASLNRAPVSTPQTASTNEDVALTATLGGSDPDAGEALTFTLESLPTRGSLELTNPATGAFRYTPTPDLNGADSFTWKVTDGQRTSATATFTINVLSVNDAPVAVGANASPEEDRDHAGTLGPLGSDVDLDDLDFSIVAPPQHGSLTAFDAETGAYTYRADPDYYGPDVFTFRATDGLLQSNVATVTLDVLPVNDVPAFTRGADVSVLEDSGGQAFPAWATALSTGAANEAQGLSFIVSAATPAFFSTPPAIGPDGRLTFATADDRHGSTLVTVRIQDDGGTLRGGVDTSPPQTFTITLRPVNDAPRFTLPATVTVDEDSGDHDAIVATGIDNGPFESGQAMTFTVTNDDATLFEEEPVLDPATGRLTFRPALNAFGETTVHVRLSDDAGVADGGADTSAEQTVQLVIVSVNDPPVAFDGETETTEDGRATGVLTGDDPVEASPLEFYVATNGAKGVAIVTDAAAGAYVYVPHANAVGVDEFTFTSWDGDDHSPSATVTVTITGNGPDGLLFDHDGDGVGFADTDDLAKSDNDGDGWINEVEWLVASDAERAHETPLNVGRVVKNPGFELGSAAWIIEGGTEFSLLDDVILYDAATGGLDSGGALGLRNTQGMGDLRLVQYFQPRPAPLAAGPILGGEFLLVDVVALEGGIAYASACYGSSSCLAGVGADQVPLVEGRNRIPLLDTAGQALVLIELRAPAAEGSLVVFDNVRIEGATIQGVAGADPVLPRGHPASVPTALLSFTGGSRGADEPLAVDAVVVDSTGAALDGYVCTIVDEAGQPLIDGTFQAPAARDHYHFRAFCWQPEAPTSIITGAATGRFTA